MFLQGLLASAKVTLDPFWEIKSKHLPFLCDVVEQEEADPTEETAPFPGRQRWSFSEVETSLSQKHTPGCQVICCFGSGTVNKAVNALLDVSHVLQHLVDVAFVKLQAQKL